MGRKDKRTKKNNEAEADVEKETALLQEQLRSLNMLRS